VARAGPGPSGARHAGKRVGSPSPLSHSCLYIQDPEGVNIGNATAMGESTFQRERRVGRLPGQVGAEGEGDGWGDCLGRWGRRARARGGAAAQPQSTSPTPAVSSVRAEAGGSDVHLRGQVRPPPHSPGGEGDHRLAALPIAWGNTCLVNRLIGL